MIEFITLRNFSKRADNLRAEFPEFAREIDRMIYKVAKNHIPECEHSKCTCKLSFEDYHAKRNSVFGTGEKADVV